MGVLNLLVQIHGRCDSLQTPEGCPVEEGVDVCTSTEKETKATGQKLKLHIF